MDLTYSIWDADSGTLIASNLPRERAIEVVIEKRTLAPDVAGDFIDSAGPAGSIAIERYGLIVLTEQDDEPHEREWDWFDSDRSEDVTR